MMRTRTAVAQLRSVAGRPLGDPEALIALQRADRALWDQIRSVYGFAVSVVSSLEQSASGQVSIPAGVEWQRIRAIRVDYGAGFVEVSPRIDPVRAKAEGTAVSPRVVILGASAPGSRPTLQFYPTLEAAAVEVEYTRPPRVPDLWRDAVGNFNPASGVFTMSVGTYRYTAGELIGATWDYKTQTAVWELSVTANVGDSLVVRQAVAPYPLADSPPLITFSPAPDGTVQTGIDLDLDIPTELTPEIADLLPQAALDMLSAGALSQAVVQQVHRHLRTLARPSEVISISKPSQFMGLPDPQYRPDTYELR